MKRVRVARATVGGVLAVVALATACAARATPDVEPPRAVLRWEARNESRVYGYLVFRSESAEGPFLRVSEEIVHAAGDPGGTGSYTWIDRDVEPGHTYYYTLDVVETNGRKRRFSSVLSKTVPG